MEAYTVGKENGIAISSINVVHCPDEDGFLYAMVIYGRETCDSGILLGPPKGLPKEIHNALVENKFYTAFDVLNKRRQILEILRELKVVNEKAVLRTIVHVYQTAYWGE